MSEVFSHLINELKEIRKKLHFFITPDEFQDDIVVNLNSKKELPRDVKFRLGKMLEQSVRIKFNRTFIATVRLKQEAWNRAKELLEYDIQFEILMADYEFGKITTG